MSEGKKEILLGDCLELMKDIPSGSIDMILCDLPYGTIACKWDVIIPFDKLWEQYKRVIKDNGAIVLTASQPFTSALVMSNNKMFKYCWVWDKISCTGNMLAKKQPLRAYEDVCVFYKLQPIYNPILRDKAKKDIRITNVKVVNNSQTHPQSEYNQFDRREHPKDKSYPTNVMRINNYGKGYKRFHPTEKPVALFEYLVKTYTNENDLVLDNCAGSGTTAIACLNTKRQFIVMEKEQKYYDMILKRVGDFNKKFETQTLFGNEM
jgi:site-specific DNA-methyltransferase (adenine-specific)